MKKFFLLLTLMLTLMLYPVLGQGEWSYAASLPDGVNMSIKLFIEDEKLVVTLSGIPITGNTMSTHMQVCYIDEDICVKTGDLPDTLASFAAIDLKNGNHELMLVGGVDPDLIPRDEAYIINYLTGEWRETGSMQIGRRNFDGRVLSDGKVVVGFGFDSNGGRTYEIWDPETEEFFFLGEADCQKQIYKMITINGSIYAVGDDEKILVFNEETYFWDLVAEFDFGWGSFAISATLDDKLLISAGNQYNPFVEYTEIAAIVDPLTGEVTMIDSVNYTGVHSAQFCADNGVCYKPGGFNVYNGFDINTVESYKDSTWTILEPMPIDYANPFVAKMLDGRYFVTGDNTQSNGANLIFSWNSEPAISYFQFSPDPPRGDTVEIQAYDPDGDNIRVCLSIASADSLICSTGGYEPSGSTFIFTNVIHEWGYFDVIVYDEWSENGTHNSSVTVQLVLLSNNVTAPTKFKLNQNYPNPFNPTTIISYELDISSNVQLIIYDLSGREVANLVNTYQLPSEYTIEWNATDLSSGTYFYKLITDNRTLSKKMVLLK